MDEAALRALYGDMSEAMLENKIRMAALAAGWLYYHTHDSRRSEPGFPDCVMVKGSRVLFRELKTQKGKVTPEQAKWLARLHNAGLNVAVWRPYDWGRGTILKELESA